MAQRGITVRETVDARKQKLGADDLPALFEGATRVVVARGKSFESFEPRKEEELEELLARALGRSGNLRAPAARFGKRWLVGYSDAAWDEGLG